MAPHAPVPGCPRINAMCYPAGAVKFREILKNHRENQVQVPKGCGVNDINIMKSKGKGKGKGTRDGQSANASSSKPQPTIKKTAKVGHSKV